VARAVAEIARGGGVPAGGFGSLTRGDFEREERCILFLSARVCGLPSLVSFVLLVPDFGTYRYIKRS
jgi:hypothetical protein